MSGWTGAGRGPSAKGAGNRVLKSSLTLAWMLGGALASTPLWAQSATSVQNAAPSQAAASAPNATLSSGTLPAENSGSPGVQPALNTEPAAPAVSAAQPVVEQGPPSQAHSPAAPPAHHASHHSGEEEPGIVVSSRPLAPDPGKALNKASFAVTQAVDQAVIEPLASGYEAIVPSTARDGLHNALYNLREPVIAANFLLQHKIGKTGETIARFVINSTIGLAGIFDIAKRKPFKLRFRENGFANTLGFYGVGNGPYIFLPMLGATTLRDFAGRMVDRGVVPLAAGGQLLPTAAVVPMIVIGILDRRLVNQERLRRERESADPYGTTRDNYLRRRAAEIEALRHPKTAPSVDEEEGG